MQELVLHHFRKYVMEKGYRIYPQPSGHNHYRIVVEKATKYSWSEIERSKRDSYIEIDKVIYSRKVGEIEYKKKPNLNDDKYWEKVNELYLTIFKKITKRKIDYKNIFKSILMTMSNNDLLNKHESIIWEIIYRFCEKHNVKFESWINDELGGVAVCSGKTYEFRDIVSDIS